MKGEGPERLARIETKLDEFMPLIKQHEKDITLLKGAGIMLGALFTVVTTWLGFKHG